LGTNFKPVEAFDTPYKRAQQIWDDRIGSARVQAYNWRLFALFSMFLNGILGFGIIYISKTNGVVPYIVEVAPNGEANAHVAIKNYAVSSASAQYFLSRFIENLRTLPSDKVITRKNLESLYPFVSKRGAQILNDFLQKNPPQREFGIKTRAVEIASVLPLSDNSFEVEWREKEYDPEGSFLIEESYRAVLEVKLKAPTRESEILANPLGIYVDYFSIARKISG